MLARASESSRVPRFLLSKIDDAFAPTEPGARSRELRRAYRELSCLTQLRLAELLRSAEDNSLPN